MCGRAREEDGQVKRRRTLGRDSPVEEHDLLPREGEVDQPQVRVEQGRRRVTHGRGQGPGVGVDSCDGCGHVRGDELVEVLPAAYDEGRERVLGSDAPHDLGREHGEARLERAQPRWRISQEASHASR